ncbi:hypothetical protein BJX64DRAFT_279954 [Aspergillus heterothallicus]
MGGFTSYHLQDLTFTGPQRQKRPAYASLAILDPIITIERHHGKYHIAARFNIETAILNYVSRESDSPELFFQDICLQDKNTQENETLVMKPESDPAAALTVSRGFTSSTSATVGVTASQAPSGSVSLGLTQSRSLTVEYAMTSWSLSAHRVVSENVPVGDDPVRYQWFWAGTQDESGRLSSDLRHAVKRHVVVKRIIPREMIVPLVKEQTVTAAGNGNDEAGSATIQSENRDNNVEGAVDEQSRGRGEPDSATADTKGKTDSNSQLLLYTWESLLDFSFSIRVKKRLSRLQRQARFTSSEVKGRSLHPEYTESFRLRVPPLQEVIPTEDTADISALLNQIKKDYENKLDELPEKDFFELASAHVQREVSSHFPIQLLPL